MRTLYIDIYFLINFTVDTLAIYFAARLCGSPTGKGRVLLGSAVGSALAVLTVLLPDKIIFKLLGSMVGLLAVGFVATKRISFSRRIRFIFAFLIFCALLGGGVNYLFGLFDGLLGDSTSELSGIGVNRKLLLMAIAVLISIGVFKMIVAFFAGRAGAGAVKVEICFLGKSYIAEALIDSGNLAVDPMDMCPVMLIKRGCAEAILPKNVIELSDPDTLGNEIRKRIRLIPISTVSGTRVLTGIRPDSVSVLDKEKSEEIKVVLAIDKEGGSFGGYEALMPAAAICDVRK